MSFDKLLSAHKSIQNRTNPTPAPYCQFEKQSKEIVNSVRELGGHWRCLSSNIL